MITARPTTRRDASATALGAAIMRAVHQVVDGEPKIIDDPISPLFIDADELNHLRREPDVFQTPVACAMRVGILAANRFAEDHLAAAVRRGVTQAVLLGAGFESFAYRQPPWARKLRIIELDHPGSQRAKREKLAAAGVHVPANVEFIGVDLDRTSLSEGLRSSSFAWNEAAFFSWLGLMPYVKETAIVAAFRLVATRPRGSEIVFSFARPAPGTAPGAPGSPEARAAIIAREAWISRFEPGELGKLLHAVGFASVEFLSAEDVTARYLGRREDELHPPRRVNVGAALV
jgi:methyltransferase (TIGR00027 family)